MPKRIKVDKKILEELDVKMSNFVYDTRTMAKKLEDIVKSFERLSWTPTSNKLMHSQICDIVIAYICKFQIDIDPYMLQYSFDFDYMSRHLTITAANRFTADFFREAFHREGSINEQTTSNS